MSNPIITKLQLDLSHRIDLEGKPYQLHLQVDGEEGFSKGLQTLSNKPITLEQLGTYLSAFGGAVLREVS